MSLINGFTPTGGQQFTILTAGSIVNNGFVLAGSAASSFNLLVNSTSVILQAIGLPGDYNHETKWMRPIIVLIVAERRPLHSHRYTRCIRERLRRVAYPLRKGRAAARAK